MSETVRKPMSRMLAFVLVVLIFVAIGPAVGTFALWVGSNYSALLSGDMNVAFFFNVFMYLLEFGYLLGFVFAAIAGLFVAISGIWMKWNNFLMPFAAAGVATIAGIYVMPVLFKVKADAAATPLLFPICLPATFVCWFLTRWIVRRTWPSV